MQGLLHFLLLALCTILHPLEAAEAECRDESGKGHQVYLSVSSRRDDRGEWVTLFSANKSSRIELGKVDMDVARKYTVCEGNHVFSIAGVLKDVSHNQYSQGGLFFKRCSSEAAITNDGRTLQRINPGGHGSALTNRPLMDDEIFTVRLDKKESKKGYVVGIGLTTHSPESLDVPNHMVYMKSGVWMFYHDHLYQNGSITNKNYAKTDLKHTKVGQKVGVMRSKFGNIHLFIEGVDQGPAASNIPKPVWGAFDLHGDALQGTIVDV